MYSKKINQNVVEVECRYCHMLGHIKNKCPKLMYKSTNQNNNNQSYQLQQPKYIKQKPVITVRTNIVDEFPVLGAPKNAQASCMNFSSVVNKKEEIIVVVDELKTGEIFINGQKMQIL